MNETPDLNAQDARVEPAIHSAGYEPEEEHSEPAAQQQAEPEHEGSTRNRQRQAPKGKTDEARRNLKAVFGQGIGRVSIIGACIVLAILIALGARSLTSQQKVVAEREGAQFEAPNAPSAPVDINPVSQKEAERRNTASAKEAEHAQQSGGSYQPAFMPNIESADRKKTDETNDIFGQQSNQVPPSSMPPPNSTGNADAERRLWEEARRRQAQAYEEAVKQRDQYVAKKQELVMKQLDKLLAENALNKQGQHTVSTYAASAATTPATQVGTALGGNGVATQAVGATQNGQRTPVIRTGNVLYAETLSEINTDDGTDAMAIIRGGPWDGSKLIGKVENRPNNIGVRFSTLAPQDGRSAMSINAIALRTEDASQGVAEHIDHHTLERYTALGAASLLSGFGKAYAQTPGTTVIAPSGTTVSTTQEPSSKQVIATTIGEMGSNLGQEIQRGFNRPTTYSTPANQGIAVFFMADVYAGSN